MILRDALGNLTGHWDDTHVWGRYQEVKLNPHTVLRHIFVYPGGRTSIHRHSFCSELNFIVGGAIRVFTGSDPQNLEEAIVRTGGMFHVSVGLYHAVEFEEGVDTSGNSYAHFYEIVYNYESPEDIDRFAPAIPGVWTS